MSPSPNLCAWSQTVKPWSEALENGSSSTVTELEEVKKKLLDISSECRVIIQWTPAHVGTDGNEEADKEANVARTEDQSRVKIGYEAAKKKFRREVNWQWQADDRTEKIYRRGIKRGGATNRLEEVLNAQVRSGHCPRTKYYCKRFGEAEDGLCEDCGEEEDRDHLLKCPRWEGVCRHMMIEDLDAWRDDYLLTG